MLGCIQEQPATDSDKIQDVKPLEIHVEASAPLDTNPTPTTRLSRFFSLSRKNSQLSKRQSQLSIQSQFSQSDVMDAPPSASSTFPLLNPLLPCPTVHKIAVPPIPVPIAELALAPPLPTHMDKQDHLLIGMHYHQLDHLHVATYHFSLAVQKQQQSTGATDPIALLLFALSLRHGWGCQKDEQTAVQLLQLAASASTASLHSIQNGTIERNYPHVIELKNAAMRSEIALALYELALCFREGSGVPKSKSTYFYYLNLSALLGDSDAQMAIGQAYLDGNGGVHKADKKMAAKWFRMAHQNGARMVCMHWIWKEKYN